VNRCTFELLSSSPAAIISPVLPWDEDSRLRSEQVEQGNRIFFYERKRMTLIKATLEFEAQRV
jgi:hypothetical protein